MSLVSADNSHLTQAVSQVADSYTRYQTSLRGAVAEALSGLSDGTLTMLTMNNGIAALTREFLASSQQQVVYALADIAQRSATTSFRSVGESELASMPAVSDALTRAFASDLEKDFDLIASKAVRAAGDFILLQLQSGRAFATSDQIAHDLEFKMTDKGGKSLALGDYITRQINWSFRTVYNTILVHVLLNENIDDAIVDGGSKHGTVLDLMNFDQLQPVYFHHNSKSLLQPID